MMMDPETYESSCAKAQEMVDDGDEDEIIPSAEIDNALPCPISAKRWLSLASPNHDGDDDYFSSDLTDQQLMKTFGSLPASSPLCILLSGSDEYTPSNVNPRKLVDRWIEIVKRGKGYVDEKHSGVMDGASHNLNGNPKEVVDDLVRRVLGFVASFSPHAAL